MVMLARNQRSGKTSPGACVAPFRTATWLQVPALLLDNGLRIFEHGAMGNFGRTPPLQNLAFALVDALAALEVGALVVLYATITEDLGVAEELSGYALTAYFYPLSGILFFVLLLHRRLRLLLSPQSLLLGGLLLFAGGAGLCGAAPDAGSFFVGRGILGVGAGLAFTGQLWTGSCVFRPHLPVLLFWGEVGAAGGDLGGPALGALFAGLGPEGWRLFFFVEGGVALITCAVALRAFGARGCAPKSAPPLAEPSLELRHPGILPWQQVAVSFLLVGSLYFFSDFFQQTQNQGPLVVALGTLLASVGTVAGAFLGARFFHASPSVPGAALGGMLLALVALGGCLAGGYPFLAALPLAALGLFSGLAGVRLYAAMVDAALPEDFLCCTLIYLLGMQLGSALGVQVVTVSEGFGFDVLWATALLAALPAAVTAVSFLSVRSTSPSPRGE